MLAKNTNLNKKGVKINDKKIKKTVEHGNGGSDDS